MAMDYSGSQVAIGSFENGKVTAIPDTSTVNTGKYSWWRKGPTSSDFIHDDVTPNFFRRAIDYIQNRSKEKGLSK